MRAVGATEFAVILWRDKLPKFNNNGKMIFDWTKWERDSSVPKIHPTQKPIGILKELIETYTDPYDVVIDPVAGSGTTLRAAYEIGRSAYGFEIERKFYKLAQEKMLNNMAVYKPMELNFKQLNVEQLSFDFIAGEQE